MSETTTKTFEFEARGVQEVLVNIRRLIHICDLTRASISGVILILDRLGLPKDVTKAIATLNTLIITVNALRIALAALQVQMGPWGWALIAASVVGGILLSMEL